MILAVPSVVGDLSLLLIRIVVATAFIVSARNKSRNLRKFAKNNGLPVPMAGFVMVAEFTGGTGMLLGILSQLAALGLMLLMLGTMRLHIFKWKSPYWASKGGWEYDLMLFTLSLVTLVHGAGPFAISI